MSYFEENKNCLTNSKISDWMKCKNYFYRKHITGEVEEKKSKALLIGDVTDNLLTELDSTKDYVVCQFDGRTKDGKEERARYEAEGKIVLAQADYELVFNIADSVLKTEAYERLILDKYERQQSLIVPWEGGDHFQYMKGKPDFYKIFDNGTCRIVDLKTTTDIDETKYHYTCLSYGYYRQAGFYSHLLQKLNPQIKKFEFYHLTVAKEKDIYPVQVFQLANERVEQALDNLLRVAEEIKKEKDFKKLNPTFETAPIIGSIVDVF